MAVATHPQQQPTTSPYLKALRAAAAAAVPAKQQQQQARSSRGRGDSRHQRDASMATAVAGADDDMHDEEPCFW